MLNGISETMSKDTPTAATNDFSGIWLSDYTYHSSDKDEDLLSQHYMRIYKRGDDLIIETVPGLNSSYMFVKLSLDGNIATGSWQEGTDPDGDYHGVIYHGATQLIIADDKKKIAGKWVGFGKNMEVKTGPWEFTYIGKDASALANLPKLVTQ